MADAFESITHNRMLIIYVGAMLGMLLASLDSTIVSTALPTIVGDLGGLNHLSWVVTAYLLTSTASTPLYGKLGDLFGRKSVFQCAVVVFLFGSILAGTAHTMGQLIAFRALQGLGAGGLMSLPLAIVGDVLSPRERGRYQGYGAALMAFSTMLGPTIGGVLTQDLSWRWCFYVNLPLGIFCFVVIGTVLNLPYARSQRRIDYAGSALLVGAVTCLLMVTVWGGNDYPWISAPVIGAAGAAALFLGLFVVCERRAPEPVLPLRLFRVHALNVANSVAFLAGAAMFGGTIYLPLFLQLVSGVPPTESGLLILPMMGAMMPASMIVGRLVSRTGRYKVFPLVGAFLIPVGLWLLSLMSARTPRWQYSLSMAVFGIGMGIVMPVIMVIVQNGIERRDLGTATSTNTFFRLMGGAFGVAVFGSVMSGGLRHWFPRLVPSSAHLSASTIALSPQAVHRLPVAIRDGIVTAFSHSLHSVFFDAIPVAALMVPIVLLMREVPLRTSAHMSSSLASVAMAEAVPLPAE